MPLPLCAVGNVSTQVEPGSRDFSGNARVKRDVTSEGEEEKLCMKTAKNMCFVFLIILKSDT